MSDITDLGSFLGGLTATDIYAELYVIATAVEKTGEDGKKYMTFDFPAQPAGLHVPPEITPAAGDKVLCIVRVPVADKSKWLAYAKLTVVGDSKVAAEVAWPAKKAEASFLPDATARTSGPTWKRVGPTPKPAVEGL